jgi:hypothetical protein
MRLRGIRDAVHALMLSLVLALTLAQVAPPNDAPVERSLTPAEQGAELPALPTQAPPDPKRWPRILLSGGAGVAGGAAALGAMVFFSNVRQGMGTAASFDLIFGTAALGSLLVTGLDFAVHQAFGGKGEASLAVLASVACMLVTGLAVGAAQVDQTTGAIMVAAVGSVPAAISVTAILEATGVLGVNHSRAW